jgi:myosin heavy subunit
MSSSSKDYGTLEDFNRYLVYRRPEGLFTVPQGKNYVWFNPDPKDIDTFETGEVKKESGDDVTVETAEGNSFTVKKKYTFERNPAKFDGVEDCAELGYLNEACVLHNLRIRYDSDVIHTYSGLFLVVLNPYKRFPIYNGYTIDRYRGRRRNEEPPHVFAVADEAYRAMLNEHQNQSMLITGESGAGKTENTKKVIQYLTVIAGKSEVGQLEQQLLQANPVLESFGNACTVRNNNSSRFGKFIEIQFNSSGYIVGASIKSYLLEKSRVVGQALGERNFHIFYQLLAGADKELGKQLRLGPASDFNYVNQGKNFTIEGVDDAADFAELKKGLSLYGIDEDDQACIWKIIAGILHLGNADMKEGASGAELVDETSLAVPAELFGVNEVNLRKGLIEPRIKAGTDWVSQHLSKEKALASRDALAKAIYHRLFLWLIKKINDTMAQPRRAFFIGVLDIAGFEIFKHNSFEQLCINYTNEKLQQFFNHHMFKLEQEEYMREKIEWNFIDFGLDCQPVIDLIEQKAPPGILALLDEQSVFPSATDDTFLRLLNGHFGKGRGHPKFREDRFGKPEIGVEHYAGLVTYTITDWIEKNRDPLQRDLDRCMKESKYNFIGRLFKEDLGVGGGILPDDIGSGGGAFGGRKKAAMFVTVGSQHKEQLASLMNTLYLTSPHFVRCILPNNEKKQHCLTDSVVLDQLRCNGVLEGIRITRKGYPNRVPYADFLKRYYFLGKGIPRSTADVKPTVINLVKQIGLTEDKYAIGLTKIFFRTGALAWIEEQREAKLSKLIIGIQAAARAYLGRAHYAELKETTVSAIIIQQNLRAYLEFKNWAWWKLFQKARPLLKRRNFEKEIQDKDNQIKDLGEKLAGEEANRQKLEAAMKVAEGQIGDLTAQLKTTRDDLDRLSDEKDALAGDKRVFELKIEELKEEIEDRKEDIEQLKAKIAASDLKYQELEDDLAAEQKKRAAFENTSRRLEAELEELRKEKDDNLEHIGTLDKIKASLQAEIDDLTKQVEQEVQARNAVERNKRKLEDELDSLQSSLAGETDQKGEALKAKKAVEQELSNTQKQLEQCNATVDQKQAQIEKLEKAMEELKAELEKETQNRQQLEAACKKLKADLQDAHDDCDDMAREKAVFEKRSKQLEDDLKELQAQLDDKIDGATILEGERVKKDAELAELRKRIQDLEGQVAKLEKEKKDLARQLAEAQTLIETLEHDKQSLLSNKRALEEKVEERNAAVANMEKDKQNIDRQRKKVEQDLRDAQTKIEELTAQNQALEDKVKSTEEQLKEAQDELEQNEDAKNANEKRKKALETDLAMAQQQAEEARKAQALTEKRKKSLEDELNQLQAELDSVDEAHKKDLAAMRAHDAELDELKRKFANESTEREKAQGQNKVLTQQNEQLRHDTEEAELAAQALQREKNKLQEQLDELQEQLDLESKQRRAQEAAKKRAEADVRNAKAQLEQQAQQYSDLSVQAKASKEEADQLRKELDEMDEKMAALRNDQKKSALETQQHKELAESSSSALSKAQSRVQTSRLALLSSRLSLSPVPTTAWTVSSSRRRTLSLRRLATS